MRTPQAVFVSAALAVLVAACGAADPSSAPAAAAPVPEAPAGPGDEDPAPAGPTYAEVLRAPELYGRVEDQIDVAASGTSSAIRYRARFVPGYTNLVEFILNNTGSGWQEKFLLQLPPTPPTSPVPLLVVFHKYGSGHGDVLNTTFLQETQARGWYCLSPLGARQKHFGNLESQINTRAALRLVANLFPIDRDRVYGVGFSMGGGAVANYAAGHLDPTDVRFAAIANHTGGVSLPHTWHHEQPSVAGELESLFGGTPAQVPFAYLRCSTIDVDPQSGAVSTLGDMARNLASIPTLTQIASADPMLYLGTQTYGFDAHLQAQNAGHAFGLLGGSVHAWTTLDETFVCDWLQTHVLQSPLAGRTLATEDGRWHDFDVEQSAIGAFSAFTWDVDPLVRHVEISATENVHRLAIHAADLGLALSGPVSLGLATADGTGDRVRLLGAPGAPLAVTRDGVPASAGYDPLTQSVEVVEADGARHVWVLTFP